MVGIVGVAGFAGAGKTTAIDYFLTVTNGRKLYLGQAVLDEVRKRGLPETRDSERLVRVEMREKNGPAAFALPFVEKVAECLANGIPVFVDAIFNLQEFDVLKSCSPPRSAHLLAIEASFAVRSARLVNRAGRTFDPDELRRRDETELNTLGTATVMASAEHRIHNEGLIEEFHQALATFLNRCS